MDLKIRSFYSSFLIVASSRFWSHHLEQVPGNLSPIPAIRKNDCLDFIFQGMTPVAIFLLPQTSNLNPLTVIISLQP